MMDTRRNDESGLARLRTRRRDCLYAVDAKGSASLDKDAFIDLH